MLVFSVLFGTNFFSVLFQSNKEIVYEYDVLFSMCLENSPLCTYGAELQLANTGKSSQNNIVVVIKNIPREVKVDTRVLNLSASNPRTNDPAIQVNAMENEYEIVVNDFSAGALIEAKFSGNVAQDKFEMLGEVSINVVSEGEVIEGSPHGTALGRTLAPLLGFL